MRRGCSRPARRPPGAPRWNSSGVVYPGDPAGTPRRPRRAAWSGSGRLARSRPPPTEAPVTAPQRPDVDPYDGPPPADLVVEDITTGDGPEARPGQTVVVHYVGVAHSTGEEFDASWNRGAPFRFPLGAGRVIGGA